MQVPEKLALIGGSILLASTLIFTLKGQASSIIPHVSHSISNVYDHIGDAEYGEFGNGYRIAQQKHWQTGTWGTSSWYIDNKGNMYVGSGQLQGSLNTTTGDASSYIHTLSFQGRIVAPQDSRTLFLATAWTGNHTLTSINGLNRIDTSKVTDMSGMFNGDAAMKSLDLSSWDTSNVQSLDGTFEGLHSLNKLNVADWNTSQVGYMGAIFTGDDSLTQLDLSHWNMSHSHFIDLPSQMKNDPAHPGTWIKK